MLLLWLWLSTEAEEGEGPSAQAAQAFSSFNKTSAMKTHHKAAWDAASHLKRPEKEETLPRGDQKFLFITHIYHNKDNKKVNLKIVYELLLTSVVMKTKFKIH